MSYLNYRYLNQLHQPNVGAPAPSNMSSQRFCLRWNNHQSNLLSVFDQLLHDESFVDVTLAVEGQLLRAHKMVLSACSPYFQALFVNHPDKHPIVILKDVPYSDMKCLLDFMYRGEVSVDQDRLTAFLRVAESLRIKGLTEVNEEKCDIPSITSSLMQTPHHHNTGGVNPPPHLHRIQQVHKRFGQMMNPLLGSALLQPKRKRGRPRKLSGSSNGTPGAMGSPAEDFDNRVGGDLLVQGSPEMLEVKMGMDGFGAGGNTDTDSSTGRGQDGQDMEDEPVKIKQEEPIAGTSKDQDAKSQDDYNSSGAESTVTVRLVPVPLRLQETTVIMSSQAAEARTVPVIQSVSADTATPVLNVNDHESGIHFLTDDQNSTLVIERADEPEPDGGGVYEMDGVNEATGIVRSKSELLEYLIRDDGSVACKLCGEVLASRTHWYRHKYKLHVTSSSSSSSATTTQTTTAAANNITTIITPQVQVPVVPVSVSPSPVAMATNNSPVSASPSPLFRCTHCNTFFKSRKGYMGHLSARHSNDTEDEAMTEVGATETVITTEASPAKAARRKDACSRGADWEQQREKEEKLVADIIDRVRRECEAQGAAVSRRGYSRRSTVMNTCN